MKFAIAYFAIGIVLIAQAIVRSSSARYELRKNTLEALTTWAGVSMLWPLVLIGEAREWWRNRRRA